jgi:NAD(P)-dependent dehydrogenase (short-subunit alcohol dehydrogenase family)
MAHARIDLEDAVVAITGAGRGIGRATAELFAERGARVCLADLDGEAAGGAAEAIGERASAYAVDVRSHESFADFIASAERVVGPIDVLVNNAGVMPSGPFLTESDAAIEMALAVNVLGPAHGMRLVLPGMLERGRGHVVNVASLLGKTELPGLASYTASKHALVGLTATVRRELAGTDVTVSVVLPSVVRTELSAGIALPLGVVRLLQVEPSAVAKAIVASCQSRSREITVPRWLGLYPAVRPLVPGRLENLVRRLIGDDRVLSAVDSGERAAYARRLADQLIDS